MQNKKTGMASWEKVKRVGVSFTKQGRLGDFGHNSPSSSSFLLNRAGEGESGAPAAMGPRPGGATAAGVEGERGSGVRGFNSPAHLGLGHGEEAGQQEQAAAALGGSGGGARGAEKGYGGGGRSWWRRATREEGAFYSPSRSVERWR